MPCYLAITVALFPEGPTSHADDTRIVRLNPPAIGNSASTPGSARVFLPKVYGEIAMPCPPPSLPGLDWSPLLNGKTAPGCGGMDRSPGRLDVATSTVSSLPIMLTPFDRDQSRRDCHITCN